MSDGEGEQEVSPPVATFEELLCPICNVKFSSTRISRHMRDKHSFEATETMIADALSPGMPKFAKATFCYNLSRITKLPELLNIKVLLLKKAAFLNKQEALEELIDIFIKGEESISYSLLYKVIAKVLKKADRKRFEQGCLKAYQNNAMNYKRMIAEQSISLEEAEAYFNYLKLFQSYLLLLFWHIGILKSAYEKAVVTFILAARELEFSDYTKAYSSITKNDNFCIWAANTKSWLQIFAGYGDDNIKALVEQLKVKSKCGFGSDG